MMVYTKAQYEEDKIALKKEQEIVADRPLFGKREENSGCEEVAKRLKNGEFIDDNKARKIGVMRLSAIIGILRHGTGSELKPMRIVEWAPESDKTSCIYALYDFAPLKVKEEWRRIDTMREDEIASWNFNRALKERRSQIDGQMSIFDYDFDGNIKSIMNNMYL